MKAIFWLAVSVNLFCACQIPWHSNECACAEHARLAFPIDLAVFLDTTKHASLLPFGVHSEANPEGHLGIDFILDSSGVNEPITVKASFAANIISITSEPAFSGSSCIVMDSACVEVNLCHLKLDANLKVGMSVTRGQSLGTIGISPVDGKYNLHFGTYQGSNAEPICPDQFLDPDSAECLLGLIHGAQIPATCRNSEVTVTLMSRSNYPEFQARNLSVKYADGSNRIFSLPAENTLCAPHLPSVDRGQLLNCLGSACTGV